MKALIGIGDSWTQGQGGVALEEFIKRGGRVDGDGQEMLYLLPQERENSWVNVLCRDHLKGYTPINLGVRGYGNRGAVKSLYVENEKVKNVTEGILIFMLSSRIRFDLIEPQGFSNSIWKFRTFYPDYDISNSDSDISLIDASKYNFYQTYYSEYFAKTETLLCLHEAQMWAKAHNLDFYFCSAFEPSDDLKGSNKEFYNLPSTLNWNNYITPNTTYYKILNEINGTPNKSWSEYTDAPMPDKYITNCIHPTIAGYKEIAYHIYKFLNTNTPNLI